MSITVESIIENVLESVEWDFQNAQSMNLGVDDYANGTMQDYAHEAIDSALIYTADILEYWVSAGMPECEDGMGDGTIMGAITWAVYEDLRENVDTWEILGAWVESHAELLPGDIASDDVEEAFEFLEEYARSEH